MKYFLLILLLANSYNFFAQQTLGFDTTILICKDKGIFEDRKIIIDKEDNIYILGFFTDTITVNNTVQLNSSVSYSDYYGRAILVSKYNKDNNLIWSRKIIEGDTLHTASIAVDSKGNYYVSANYTGTVYFSGDSLINTASDPDIYVTDAVVLKFDSNGVLIHKRILGGINGEAVNELKIDNDDNLFIGGTFNHTWLNSSPNYEFIIDTDTLISNNQDVFVAKFNGNDSLMWAKKLSTIAADNLTAMDVFEKNIFVVLATPDCVGLQQVGGINFTFPLNWASRNVLCKLDSLGNGEWLRKFGALPNNDLVGAIGNAVKISHNRILLGGFGNSNNSFQFIFDGSSSLNSVGNRDYFLVSYDTQGLFKWGNVSSSLGNEYIVDIQSDTLGNFCIAGNLSYNLEFTTDTIYSHGGNDIFVCSYDSNGNYRYAISDGGTGNDIVRGFAKDKNDKLYIVGGTTSSNGLYMGNDTLYPPNNQSTLFFASIDSIPIHNQEPASIYQAASHLHFQCYPNPAHDVLYIRSAVAIQGQLSLYNMLGEKLTSVAMNSKDVSVNTSRLPEGIYTLQLQHKGFTQLKKILIQH